MRRFAFQTPTARTWASRFAGCAWIALLGIVLPFVLPMELLAARTAPPDSSDEEHDATEIAARAIASAAASKGEEDADDLESEAYDAVVRDLLLRIDTIQKESGNVSRQLETPLLELGKLYLSANQCRKAIPLLKQTTSLIRQLDGVMSTRQIPIYDLLAQCYITEDLPGDLQQAQEQVLIIQSNSLGADDVRMIPPLVHAGECYEQAGLYDNAQEQYTRAIRLAQKAGGDESVHMIAPLRAMARTYRLRMQFDPSSAQPLAQGERLLQRASRIARDGSDVGWQVRVATLLDLGDWLQFSGPAREAMKLYREAWEAAVAGGGPERAAKLFDEPRPILYRAAEGVPLRRSPPDAEKLKHYWIDYEFTVTRNGDARDVIVRESTAPRDIQTRIAENLKRTRFRPSLVDGQARDVSGMRIRQGVWVQP